MFCTLCRDLMRRFLSTLTTAQKIIVIIIILIIIISTRNMKANVIPVIIGAKGTISKSLIRNLRNIPGKHEIKEKQKTAILGTAHILRKVLM